MIAFIIWGLRLLVIFFIVRMVFSFLGKPLSGKKKNEPPKTQRFKNDKATVVDGDFKEL